jgi:hypothetical protein
MLIYRSYAHVPARESFRAPQRNSWSSADSSRCGAGRNAPFSAGIGFWRDTGGNVGNNNDHSRVQRFLSMQNKKVGAVVRYKRVILCADCGHELPVFRTAEAEIIDVICYMTCRMR